MKVVCVDHKVYDNCLPYGPNDPKIGDECIVINTCIGYDEKGKGMPCYELEGYTTYVYDIRNFAPLSDLDETTLVNEEWEQKVCEPVNRKL